MISNLFKMKFVLLFPILCFCFSAYSQDASESYAIKDTRDRQTYKTVKIGNQTWMAENLKAKKFTNGDPIENVTDNSKWGSLSYAAWSSYDNKPENEKKFGLLYNWYAVSDPRGVCPQGWHLPTDKEWEALETTLGGVKRAGGKMKASGLEDWQEPNENATNESGFNALPAGIRYFDGSFFLININTYFWSMDNYEYRYLTTKDGVIGNSSDSKEVGVSVRCVQD